MGGVGGGQRAGGEIGRGKGAQKQSYIALTWFLFVPLRLLHRIQE